MKMSNHMLTEKVTKNSVRLLQILVNISLNSMQEQRSSITFNAFTFARLLENHIDVEEKNQQTSKKPAKLPSMHRVILMGESFQIYS